MLDREHDFYQRNRSKLFSRYPRKTIVIKGAEVIGVYDSHEEAYKETTKTQEVGSFIIKTLEEKK